MLRGATLALFAGSAAALPAARHHKTAPLQLDTTDDGAAHRLPFRGFHGHELALNSTAGVEFGGCEARECEESNQCHEWKGMPDINQVEEMQCGVFWFLHIEKNAGTVVTEEMETRSGNLPKDEGYNKIWKQGEGYNSRWNYYSIVAPQNWDSNINRGSNWYWQDSNDWKGFQKELKKDKPNAILHWHWGAAPLSEMADNGYLHKLACQMKAKGCELRLSAILREPMSRTISKMGFDKVEKSELYEFMNFDSNPQSKYIVYNDETHWPKELKEFDASNPGRDDWVLGKTWEMLKYFDAIGQSENVVSYLNYVEKSLGWKWTSKSMDIQANPSSLPYKIDDKDYEVIRKRLKNDRSLYWSFCKYGSRPKQDHCPAGV